MDSKTIEQFIDKLTNTQSERNKELFLQARRELHPTLRQVFTGFCLAWINEHAADNSSDGRITASRDVCFQVVENYRLITGREKLPDRFPLV